jgi:hypothetical protein
VRMMGLIKFEFKLWSNNTRAFSVNNLTDKPTTTWSTPRTMKRTKER